MTFAAKVRSSVGKDRAACSRTTAKLHAEDLLSQSGIHSYSCPVRSPETDCKWFHSSRPLLHRHRHRRRPRLGLGSPRCWNSQRSSRRPAEQRKSPGSPVLISLFLSRCSASRARFEHLVFYTYEPITPASGNHKTEPGTDGVAVLYCVRRVKEAADRVGFTKDRKYYRQITA